jgi:hypothetical protein
VARSAASKAPEPFVVVRSYLQTADNHNENLSACSANSSPPAPGNHPKPPKGPDWLQLVLRRGDSLQHWVRQIEFYGHVASV